MFIIPEFLILKLLIESDKKEVALTALNLYFSLTLTNLIKLKQGIKYTYIFEN